MKKILLFVAFVVSIYSISAQNILPTPQVVNLKEGKFIFPKKVGIFWKKKDAYAFHKQGILVIPWTPDTSEEIRRLKSMAVDGVITDYPDLFAEF